MHVTTNVKTDLSLNDLGQSSEIDVSHSSGHQEQMSADHTETTAGPRVPRLQFPSLFHATGEWNGVEVWRGERKSRQQTQIPNLGLDRHNGEVLVTDTPNKEHLPIRRIGYHHNYVDM